MLQLCSQGCNESIKAGSKEVPYVPSSSGVEKFVFYAMYKQVLHSHLISQFLYLYKRGIPSVFAVHFKAECTNIACNVNVLRAPVVAHSMEDVLLK